MNLPGELVLASGNRGKIEEIGAALARLGCAVVGQRELGVEDPEETGLTFVENAIIKARNACRRTGRASIADDSGLEVDCLGGAPGIYSSRYAGPEGDAGANVAKLLDELEPLRRRQPLPAARFRCVMVYLRHGDDPSPVIAQGQWEGAIAAAPRGDGGFGYDPVFWLPGLGLTAAELELDAKNRLSHRGQALRALVEVLGRLGARH